MVDKIEHNIAKDGNIEFEIVDDGEENSGDGGVTELDAVDEEETMPEMNIHDGYNVEYFYEDRNKESKRSKKNRKMRQSKEETIKDPIGSHMGLPPVTDDARQDEGVIIEDGTEANPS